MENVKSAETQIKEAVWQYTGWGVLLTAVFLSGVALGYILWGDALQLRGQVTDLTQKVSGVRTERENLQAQVGRLQREAEKLAQENQQLKGAASQ
jgi:cell division protein FtsL